jgi:hypothetical protein
MKMADEKRDVGFRTFAIDVWAKAWPEATKTKQWLVAIGLLVGALLTWLGYDTSWIGIEMSHWWIVPVVLVALVVVYFFWHAYLVWKAAKEELFSTQDKLNSKVPVLIPAIEQTVVGGISDDPSSAMVFVTMSIVNRGEPSIADNWAIYVRLKDGRSAEGKKILIEKKELYDTHGPSKLYIPGYEAPSPARIITPAEAIYEKTMSPIPRGGKASGLLQAFFQGIKQAEIATAGTEIRVEFKDAFGQSCSCVHIWGNFPVPLSQAERYPGV